MQKKQAVFRVKGMSRDLAVSKFNPEMAYEIKNMRLLATDDSTTLSLVNEKGTYDTGITIYGNVIGLASFSDKLIVFSHNPAEGISEPDKISKIFFDGSTLTEESLYSGNLQFDREHPIETIPLYESEHIQKVYWVDGKNQPRVINVEDGTIQDNNDGQFDFLPELALNESVTVERVTDRGGLFPSGVLQYCITYSQQNGQESSIVWSSEPLYTILDDRGGSANENTNAAYRLIINSSDINFDFVNLYSIIKTSESGEFVVRRATRVPTSTSPVIIYDTNTTGEVVDATSLLFKGGDKVIAGTMAAKDNTLFLGDLHVDIDNVDENDIKVAAKACSVVPTTPRDVGQVFKIDSYYDYSSVSSITNSFKYLKKDNFYRIGIQLQDKYGKWSTPLFVKDLTASEAPKMGDFTDASDRKAQIPTYKIQINQGSVDTFYDNGFKKVRPVIVYPTPSKRRVIAQGTVCPTVASVGQRNSIGIWGQSSWFFRPFNVLHDHSSDINKISAESVDLHFLPANDKYNAEIQSMEDPPTYADGSILSAISSYQNDYFVDSSLVTFHTPDVDNLTDFDLKDAKFRITGCFYLSSVSGRFNLNTQSKKVTSSVVGDNYVFRVAFGGGDNILLTRTLWKDTDYYLTYPWHRNGSLNADAAGDSATDKLQSKVIANLRCSQEFYQLEDYWNTPSTGITSPVINEGTATSLSTLDTPENIIYAAGKSPSKLTYYGGNDSVISPTTAYNIYKAEDKNDTPVAVTGASSTDPIPIRYNSTKHIVFSFNHRIDHTQVALPIPKNCPGHKPEDRGLPFWLYQDTPPTPENPYLVDYIATASEGEYIEDIARSLAETDNWSLNTDYTIAEVKDYDSQSNLYRIFRWKCQLQDDSIIIANPDTSWIDSNFDSVKFTAKYNTNWATVNTPYEFQKSSINSQIFIGGPTSAESIVHEEIELPSTYHGEQELMWIGELYRDIQSPEEVFGNPNNDFELSQNQWVPAGEAVSIADDNPVDLLITEGDTFFDRWDCLKTYPISVDDPNQLVEILSFMCESYTNLEGRYDKNRGLVDNTYINNTNFNLFNPVYNDISNYFRFRTLDFQDSREEAFPSSITYSLTKTLGEEIDTWANVNLASILNLDGDKGRVTAIRRYNNDLIAFQPLGISQILFNENVQIATTTGVPIEIANSGKVQGKRYISSEIGCLNKWSICSSANGLYFADDYARDFYLINGNGINSLTDRLGFHSWVINKFNGFTSQPWSPSTANFTTHYDKVNNELLITSPDDSLAYSENLGQFSSFYDYDNVSFMGTLNEKNIMFRVTSNGSTSNGSTTKLWIEHEGEYNKFFGNLKDYSVEVVVNQEPLTDKVFNNIEFRADDFDETDGYLLGTTFDKLEVQNEYQKGVTDLEFKRDTPSSLKRKFRIWRANIPRWNVNMNGQTANGRDRMRNPWLKVKLLKNHENYTEDSGITKTVLHDIVIDYLT